MPLNSLADLDPDLSPPPNFRPPCLPASLTQAMGEFNWELGCIPCNQERKKEDARDNKNKAPEAQDTTDVDPEGRAHEDTEAKGKGTDLVSTERRVFDSTRSDSADGERRISISSCIVTQCRASEHGSGCSDGSGEVDPAACSSVVESDDTPPLRVTMSWKSDGLGPAKDSPGRRDSCAGLDAAGPWGAVPCPSPTGGAVPCPTPADSPSGAFPHDHRVDIDDWRPDTVTKKRYESDDAVEAYVGHVGRPDWGEVVGGLGGGRQTAVLTCGPPAMVAQLERVAWECGMDFHKEVFMF